MNNFRKKELPFFLKMDKKGFMIFKFILLILLFTTLYASAETFQKIKLSGVVTDGGTNSSLAGVNVTIEGTTVGVITGADGKYIIETDKAGATLVFSFIGYATQRISVQGRTEINITLIPDVKSLEEIVVVGYGTQKRSDLTGSVASISSKDIGQSRVMNVDQALQGVMAGVQVSSQGGKPGAGMSVNIRGVNSTRNNQPLYVVDGIQLGNGGGVDYNNTESYNLNSKVGVIQNFDISSINPDDIATIDVLKDASSTAIYGSRAANGVVLITTKKGQKGQAKVNFSAVFGQQKISKKIEMLNGEEYMDFYMAAYRIAKNNPALTNTTVFDNIKNNIGPGGYNTVWQDEIYNPAPQKEYNLSVSGGINNLTYYIGGGYNKQEGIAGKNTSGFEKYTIKTTIENQVRNWLKIGLNLNGGQTKSGLIEMFNSFSVTNDALANMPFLPVQWNTTGLSDRTQLDNNIDFKTFGYNYRSDFIPGGWSGPGNAADPTSDGNNTLRRNPVAQMNLQKRQVNKYQGLGSLYADFTPIKNLIYHIELNGTLSNGFWFTQFPFFRYGYRTTEDALDKLNAGRTFGFMKEINQYLTYSIKRSQYNISLMAGHTASESNIEDMSAAKYNAINPSFILDQYEPTGQSAGGGKSVSRMESFFGRGTFSLKDKYLLTTTLRRDGSDKFSKENKYATFPSLALAWKVSNEGFMSSFTWLSSMKLRGGWGKTGAQNIDAFSYASLVENVNLANFGSNIGRRGSVMYVDKIANPNVKWETTNQIDVGLDAAFLENRLILAIDLYKKNTTDLLLGSYPLPSYVGKTGATVNLGEFQNSGIDFQVDFRNILKKKDFIWDFGVNFSKNKTEVIDIGPLSLEKGGVGYISFGSNTRGYVGKEYGVFWGYNTDGILQTPEEIAALNANAVSMATANGIANPNNIKFQTSYTEPGDVKFVDINGVDKNGKIVWGVPDGRITVEDNTPIGNSLPKFYYGINTRLSYKGLDLYIAGSGVYGNSIYNQNLSTFESLNIVDPVNQTKRAWENRWISVDQPGDGKTPRVLGTKNTSVSPCNNGSFSDRYISSGSYFRIRNITLGYKIPGNITNHLKISNMRVYATLLDFFTFTKYEWYNPDLGISNGSTGVQGIDKATYPNAKSILFGVNIGF